MPHRTASPAASENGFDLTNALFDDPSDALPPRRFLAGQEPDLGEELNGVDDNEDDDEDEAFIEAAQAALNRKTGNLKGKTAKKGGGFQSMGLNAALLKAITRKGFSVPTPIQRKTIPLLLDGQDVVGMARTGSGKTAAFVIPMIEKLKMHSVQVGARAIIMSPSRELALQTLKVVKELGKGTTLRTVLLVGGDSLEDQFASMTTNPDIIIATPGRFLHLKVEMGLDLSSIRYMVFDEADRLFEMGFAAQLTEIIHALPPSRQTLLFSATLPKSLVEFARAGLQEPTLVRLDAESKVSPDLQSAFFAIKSADKEGALLFILQDVIQMPYGDTDAVLKLKEERPTNGKKRKRGADAPASESPTAHSTIIFTATKHHVEYIASLLRTSGYAVSYVYGALDQTARKIQVQNFRSGLTNILVVTDVAARGIDIPVLANVINYDFPSQPKIFVHRVGRTARAGKRGWSYSLVRDGDVPYLLDLQLFLSKKLVLGRDQAGNANFAEDVVVGTLPRDKVEQCVEFANKLIGEDIDLAGLRQVAAKGEKLYTKTRNSASIESAKRAKDVLRNPAIAELNILFDNDSGNNQADERDRMLARISGFRPNETVFELGKRGGGGEAGEIVRKRREKIDSRKQQEAEAMEEEDGMAISAAAADDDDDTAPDVSAVDASTTGRDGHSRPASADLPAVDMDSASDDELEITFSQPSSSRGGKATGRDKWHDAEHYMAYQPASQNLAEDRGYGVHSGSYDKAHNSGSFVEAARGATMDLAQDETRGFGEASGRSRGMRWDRKSKKYVSRANDEDGSKGAKMVRGESGQLIAASFRSGRFEAWRKSNRIARLPRVGESEKKGGGGGGGMDGVGGEGAAGAAGTGGGGGPSGRRFRHRVEKAPKEADRFRDDYHVRKKRVEEAKEKRVGRFKEGAGKSELRGAEDVRKLRKLKEKRKMKNARTSKRR
ncbi:ATP-dependent RNA helicase dbp10 [Aulographum hederae CBS 113979]|uniref:RNA helicase n=1 Tax=Aulographum hederae CBS 113979 TaxID=1176131 RepID=A0A6G1H7U2_9PEZI|nr:ATP-dependent RNA helicase dbp10 [Aulographum hederae CBS 113979]